MRQVIVQYKGGLDEEFEVNLDAFMKVQGLSRWASGKDVSVEDGYRDIAYAGLNDEKRELARNMLDAALGEPKKDAKIFLA